jgi:hypothetical protein
MKVVTRIELAAALLAHEERALPPTMLYTQSCA